MGQRQVVVVGGGVSGLATAHYLTRGERPPAVTVLEAGLHLGGKVRTISLAGHDVDTGPDALLVRAPAADALLTELGLDPLRRGPDPAGAYIWARGRLRPLPQGSVFGVPD
ncbi:MAG: FAD-dependent oxidoreductase, partial [Kineosporiaceae bacterium]